MQLYEYSSSYSYISLVLFMLVVGVVTNTLNLVILSRKSMNSTTNKYLYGLAICDICVLIFSALSLSNSFVHDYSKSTDSFISSFDARLFWHSDVAYSFSDDSLTNQTNLIFYPQNLDDQFNIKTLYYNWVMFIYPIIYPYVYPLAIMFQFCTVWINLGMSTDRFIAINFPFKSLKFCTIQNAKRNLMVIFLISMLYSLPRFFEYSVHLEKLSIGHNQTVTYAQYDLTKIGKSRLYRQVVYFWMYILMQSVVPLIILIILNTGLILSLKDSHRYLIKFYDNNRIKNRNLRLKRNGVQNSFMNRELKCKEITLMLIFLVVLFIILHSPSAICNCVYAYNYSSVSPQSSSFDLNKMCNVGNFFIITSSSTNFFTYILFNRRFRKELLVLFRCPSN